MNKIIGAGVEQIDKYEFEKRQYSRGLDLWQERADQERQVYYEKRGQEPDNKKWRGLLHIIAKFKLDAYTAGIDGGDMPNVISDIESMADQFSDDPMGSMFFGVIADTLIDSYTQGQEARG